MSVFSSLECVVRRHRFLRAARSSFEARERSLRSWRLIAIKISRQEVFDGVSRSSKDGESGKFASLLATAATAVVVAAPFKTSISKVTARARASAIARAHGWRPAAVLAVGASERALARLSASRSSWGRATAAALARTTKTLVVARRRRRARAVRVVRPRRRRRSPLASCRCGCDSRDRAAVGRPHSPRLSSARLNADCVFFVSRVAKSSRRRPAFNRLFVRLGRRVFHIS